MTKPRVNFVCSGNSVRRQMAEAFLRQFAGDYFEVDSAGLHANPIHSFTIQVMEEPSYDLCEHTSK